MKTKKLITTLFTMIIVSTIGCEDALVEEPFSQVSSEIIFENESSARTVLYSSYAKARQLLAEPNQRLLEDWTVDLEWSTGGSVNRFYQQLANFTWNSALEILPFTYRNAYEAIRNANIVLDNEDRLPDTIRQQFMAEARFVRAWMYAHLYNIFGPTPLRTSNDDPVEQARATEEEMKSFIESELLEVLDILPNPGDEEEYGRATKGMVMALLTKYYLNDRQWQKAADMAEDLIDLGYYQLFPNYLDQFKVENNGNREAVLVLLSSVQDPPNWTGNPYLGGWFPPNDWAEMPELGIVRQSSWVTFAVQYRLFDEFYNSFDPSDERRKPIVTYYLNNLGDTVQLLGNDNARSMKHFPDPNNINYDHGNDLSMIRYADILLSRAEALNELNGPNQESINLINQVRNRANLADLNLADFGSKDELNNHILQERAWEFYAEKGIRRQDLIRHDKFISSAQDRGIVNAQPFHVRFPFPQTAMDSNPSLVQNEGY